MHRVFVYGTLKKGEPNHHWFNPSEGYSKFLYDSCTTNQFPLIIATQYNIPFLLNLPGIGHKVHGEVYEVDQRMLENLDVLEDHPNYYIRELHEVQNVQTGELESNVWIYMIKTFNKELLTLPMLERYNNLGEHGLRYVGRYERDTNVNIRNQIMTLQ